MPRIAHQAVSRRKILIITNDFPPRRGGIETFVYEISQALPPEDIIVLTRAMEGAAEFDSTLKYPVIRREVPLLLPTRATLSAAQDIISAYGCSVVWFGAAAPLGLLAKKLRSQQQVRIIATTHGHELWWSRVPGFRRALRRIATQAHVVTYLGEYFRIRLAPLSPRLEQLTPGVNSQVFQPITGARETLWERYSLPPNTPIVLCISRLVQRKGQDVLIRLWPGVRQAVPGAVLILAGAGPYEKALRRQARGREGIIFAGKLDQEELPLYYSGASVFAMPCRSRALGLEAEGLGIVYLEAQSCGTPVIVGNSGGAPDAVQHEATGIVVDGTCDTEVQEAVIRLLKDPHLARSYGQRGRQWMLEQWQWEQLAQRLRAYAGLE